VSTSGPDRLYELLPLIYRARDLDQGEPLRALLGVIGEEYDTLRRSIAKLEESWFIETCDPQIIPFIGDLVGVSRTSVERAPLRVRRALVGNAIRYRRRKGIAAVLERAIEDATGFSAHAASMLEHLGVTQHVAHVSPEGRLFDVRAAASVVPEPGVLSGAHTAEVRSTGDPERAGRFNLCTVAVFLSRLQSYPVEWSQPARVKEGCYTFHPLGLDTPLFTQPLSDDDPLRPRELTDLVTRISPRAFEADLTGLASRRRESPTAPAPARWFGPGASIEILHDGELVDAGDVVSRDLSDWERPAEHVAIDVARGRMAFPRGAEPEALRVSWSFGRVTDVGAGPYPREPASAASAAPSFVAEVCASWPAGTALTERQYRTLTEAIAAWHGAGGGGLLRIRDSSTYDAPLVLDVGARDLRIEADLGEVPTVAASIDVEGAGGSLTLAGLELGAGLIYGGSLRLALASCTVHGAIEQRAPSPSDRVSLSLTSCLAGPIRMAGPTGAVSAVGSIVHGTLDGRSVAAICGPGPDERAFGPALSLSRTTVIGDVAGEVLSQAEECLFTGDVRVRRTQASVLRFCAVPHASGSALARYRSALFAAPPGVPEAEAIAGAPRLASLALGDPAYGRLADDCPAEIRFGAEDGGEVGAFHDVNEQRRRTQVRATLDEFLPAQIEATVLFID
jgi:hypothetical protein